MKTAMKKTIPVLLSAAISLAVSGQAYAQAPITKSMTVTGNQVGPFNVIAHVQGPTQTLPMGLPPSNPKTQAMFYKSGGMDDCPDDKGTPTPPVTSSPTAVPVPPGYAPPVVPPMGSQTGPDGTNISVYPGGTTIVTPGGGGTPISIPPGLGNNPAHGPVIARQVRPDGSIVQIYEDGHYSVTRGGTTRFSTKAIW